MAPKMRQTHQPLANFKKPTKSAQESLLSTPPLQKKPCFVGSGGVA